MARSLCRLRPGSCTAGKNALINCLAMGFRILGLRYELLLLPIVLSLVAAVLPPVDLSFFVPELEEMVAQLQAVAASEEPAGGANAPGSDLFEIAFANLGVNGLPIGAFLVNRAFFRVPGYVTAAPMGAPLPEWSWPVDAVWDFILLVFALMCAGFMLGAVYQFRLAQFVPAAPAADGGAAGVREEAPAQDFRTREGDFLFRIGQILFYFAFLLVIWVGSVFLMALFVGLIGLAFAQALVGGYLLSLAMTSYFMIGLLFLFYQTYVTAGVMLDGLSLWAALRRSAQLVGRNLLSTGAFLLLAGFIMLGMDQLLQLLIEQTRGHLVSIMFSIVVFAYVGTGVALAFLVFYRTRCLLQRGNDVAAYFELQEN